MTLKHSLSLLVSAIAGCGVLLGSDQAEVQTARAEQTAAAITRLEQVCDLADRSPDTSYPIHLEGNLWWVNATQDRFVLQDATGAVELTARVGNPGVKAGDRVRFDGNGTIRRVGAGFQLGVCGPVVDNNGTHNMREKAAAAYLTAGRQPVRVEWFNGVEKFGLVVEYEGQGLPRQRIPDGALWRSVPDGSGRSNWVNGVQYRAYEGDWEGLPDFASLTPVASGVTSNFTLQVRTRDEHVAVLYESWLELPREGVYVFHLTSDDGSRLFVEGPPIQAQVVGSWTFPKPRPVVLGQMMPEAGAIQWAQVEGQIALVRKPAGGVQIELTGGAGRLQLELGDSSGLPDEVRPGSRIRAVGFCEQARTVDGQRVPGALLVPSAKELEVITPPPDQRQAAAAAGVLTTASEVLGLAPEEVRRPRRVSIRGVVTSVLPQSRGFTLQDATHGLYIEDWSIEGSASPSLGEWLEVEGYTDPGQFAPTVHAQRISDRGLGQLPPPVHPTWDQLLNGSLDAQYVELRGTVTSVQSNGVMLWLEGGPLLIDLRTWCGVAADLKGLESALVRVRGCLFASWDYATHEVKADLVRIYDADVFVEQPPPKDVFSCPAKSARGLRLFDPQASVFERVKVTGQVVYAGESECFLMDQGSGLRFITKQAAQLQAGDLVEVAGFPTLSTALSPVLHETVVRRVGHAALPPPTRLSADDLGLGEHDATRVQVEGVLVAAHASGGDLVLELQKGVRRFIARSKLEKSPWRPELAVGSRLQITGVCAFDSGNRATGREGGAFNLLLTSPADIVVLAAPPWWTLQRLLVVCGVLAGVLTITLLWLSQMRRLVEVRTAQLEAQIHEREKVEHQHAIEHERARVAHDLHDELGSGLTEISMLAARAGVASAGVERRIEYLQQMESKAREMVIALDEIVWAMNPKHDSTASLASYFRQYADRFLGLANIACRTDMAAMEADYPIDSQRRHQLFLAFKEALTNVVRHSGATELHLDFRTDQKELQVAITDNGRGLPANRMQPDMDGVRNMRERLEELGGRFEITNEPGRGLALRFRLPID